MNDNMIVHAEVSMLRTNLLALGFMWSPLSVTSL